MAQERPGEKKSNVVSIRLDEGVESAPPNVHGDRPSSFFFVKVCHQLRGLSALLHEIFVRLDGKSREKDVLFLHEAQGLELRLLMVAGLA